MMFLKFLLLLHPICLRAFELCDSLENIYNAEKNHDKNVTYRITVSNSSEICEDLDNLYNTVGERLIHNIGDVYLYLKYEPPFMKLFLAFHLLTHWTKALIKVSDSDPKSCQAFTVDKDQYFMDDLQFGCILNEDVDYKKTILLQVYSDNDSQFSQKKILFGLPNFIEFSHVSFSTPRHIFSYIDFTNPAKILLKIQPLNEIFKVSHYKVEVFREKDHGVILLDVRVISTKDGHESLSFAYDTYNEEGYYYFAISEIGEYCPEDACYKTFTPKVHITRKSKPLVIGIIGACYVSYFFLFSLFWWKYRYRNQANRNIYVSGVCICDVDECFVLTQSSFDQHNDVVSALIRSIENLATPRRITIHSVNLSKEKERETFGKFCANSDNSAFVVYVNPPSSDFDSNGLDFLDEEMKKPASRKKFVVVRLPYSKSEIPGILSNDQRFELMKDFGRFMKEFCGVACSDYSKLSSYKELAGKIELAVIENEALGRVPEIVVTEDGEEAGEVDGLIKTYCQG